MPEFRRIAKHGPALRLPQIRVLRALADGSALTRIKLAEAAGFTSMSGTVTRVLNGIREGSSSGAAHSGLVALGLVVKAELDLDGLTETVYCITGDGLTALAAVPDEARPLRDRDASTNRRYKGPA